MNTVNTNTEMNIWLKWMRCVCPVKSLVCLSFIYLSHLSCFMIEKLSCSLTNYQLCYIVQNITLHKQSISTLATTFTYWDSDVMNLTDRRMCTEQKLLSYLIKLIVKSQVWKITICGWERLCKLSLILIICHSVNIWFDCFVVDEFVIQYKYMDLSILYVTITPEGQCF